MMKSAPSWYWLCGTDRRPLRRDPHMSGDHALCLSCWRRPPAECWGRDVRAAVALAAALNLSRSWWCGARRGLVQETALQHAVRAYVDASAAAHRRAADEPFSHLPDGVLDRARQSLALRDERARTGRERRR